MSQWVRKSLCWHKPAAGNKASTEKGTPPIVPTYPKQVVGGRVQNQKAQLGPNAQCHKITTDSKSESIHVNENAQLVVTQVEIKTLTEQSNKIHFSVPGRL